MEPAIAILGGTGRSGPGMAGRLAVAGVPVVVGSRDGGRARAVALQVSERVAAAGGGAPVEGDTNVGAAIRGATAILTIPYHAQATLLPGLRAELAGKVVVSTTVPMALDAGRLPIHLEVEGSAAEEVAALLPESRVAAGFHTVSSRHLGRLGHPIEADVVVTGDDVDARRATMALAMLLPGARAVDGGALRFARYCEQLTVLLLSINGIYRRNCGITITDLPRG